MEFVRTLLSSLGIRKKKEEVKEEGEKAADATIEEGQQNEVKTEETAAVAPPAVESTPEKAEEKPAEPEQPKVEEVVTKPAEPEAPKTDDSGAVAAVLAAAETIVQNGCAEAETLGNEISAEAETLVDCIKQEAEKLTNESITAISNGLSGLSSKAKDLAPEILSTETNGLDASPSNEVAAAE
ncbi:unnamed protein product [Allacma fusca]|uniref:Uncharacterized protein n=1 Tax=Allacma fusca TaxID=39272 RepID=A0A8J2MAQ3_9HEXA|nr:unnamed protein product [Allacma fusca]